MEEVQVHNVQNGNVNYRNDEITFHELCNMLWKQKGLILIVTFCCILVSVVYLVIKEPVYEAKAFVVPPASSDIGGLNIGRSNGENSPLKFLTVNQVFRIFTRHFLSESVKREFFNTVYFPALSEKQKEQPRDRTYAHYLKSITLKDESKLHYPKYLISVNSTSNTAAYDWVNEYIALASQRALSDIEASVNSENKSLANYDLLLFNKEKEIARKKNEDKLIQLQEALSIAKAAGIKSPSPNLQLDQMKSESLMYLRGSLVLQEEIKNILNRKNSDPIVPKIRKLEAEYNFYNDIKLPMESIKIYQLDGDVTLTDTPTSPKKNLILLFALFGGLMLGCLIAMMRRSFVKNA